MTPRQFCSKLQNMRVVPRLGKGPHVTKVSEAEALHTGELRPKISGEPIDHLRPPPLSREAGGEFVADGPIEQDGFLVE